MATSTTSRPAAFAASGPARRRGGPRRRLRRNRKNQSWWPLIVLGLVVLAGVTWARSESDAAAGSCVLPLSSVPLTSEQLGNATTIAEVGQARGLPERAVVIALATAMQESRLRNLDYGDRDSLGLFQQRPSQGWGAPHEVRDPAYAAGKFYDHLLQVPDWQAGELTLVADAVQRSAYPLAYGKWSAMATELAAAFGAGDHPCS